MPFAMPPAECRYLHDIFQNTRSPHCRHLFVDQVVCLDSLHKPCRFRRQFVAGGVGTSYADKRLYSNVCGTYASRTRPFRGTKTLGAPLGQIDDGLQWLKNYQLLLDGLAGSLTSWARPVIVLWLLTAFRHVAGTLLHHAAVPVHLKNSGLFQRQVVGWLSERDFRRYSQGMRPRLQDLCTALEASLSLERRT
jgi:hypothetical protein